MYASAEASGKTSADRVRRSTAPRINERIDREIELSVKHHRRCPPSVVRQRIQTLDEEWDIERVLEVNASTLAVTGLLLGSTVNRKWLALPAAVLGFLFPARRAGLVSAIARPAPHGRAHARRNRPRKVCAQGAA